MLRISSHCPYPSLCSIIHVLNRSDVRHRNPTHLQASPKNLPGDLVTRLFHVNKQQQQQPQKQPQASPDNQEEEKEAGKNEAKPQPQHPQPQPSKPTPTSIPSPKKGIPVRVSGIVSSDGGNKPSSSGVIQSSGEVKRNFIRPRDLK